MRRDSYRHKVDEHDAPLDPNFTGAGRTLTDENGHYWFKTIKPGPYPWGNHHNAWRPAHIHFSLFGAGILSRLVTQMYFPGDPLQPLDPIFNSIPDEAGTDAAGVEAGHGARGAGLRAGLQVRHCAARTQ